MPGITGHEAASAALRIYYFSMDFLIGRALNNNIIEAGQSSAGQTFEGETNATK